MSNSNFVKNIWYWNDQKKYWDEGMIEKEINNSYKIKNLNGKIITLEKDQVVENIFDNKQNTNDLINLPHLHEPGILYTLKKRYEEDLIYTKTGPILLAINPFKKLDIYNSEILNSFKLSENKIDIAHVFGTARDALDLMLTFNQNQTVLASGESGSGKTVTTKHLLHYLTTISKQMNSDKEDKLERVIIDSNPIIEAFGNAKTIRNDNSSRFGKFIKLNFKEKEIVSGKIETYLLEKIRVIEQSKGERNFHIFYQILSDKDLVKKYDLGTINDYKLISDPEASKRQDGINDYEEFRLTLKTLKSIGLLEQEINEILEIVILILNLGNISFKTKDDKTIIIHDKWYNKVIKISNWNGQLEDSLCHHTIKVGREEVKKNLNLENSKKSLHTFIKVIYEHLFDYLVTKINKNLESDIEPNNFIGILDIFGFEIFNHNSLEQLHINYTNERLQELFNQFIFKVEEEEYKKEGIKWDPIDFPDNKLRIRELHKIFGHLNDQTMVGKENDTGLYQNICKLKSEYLEIVNKERFDQKFGFTHYAGQVKYTVDNYCEKNKHHLRNEFIELLNFSDLAKEIQKITIKKSSQLNSVKDTINTEFNSQLVKLVSLIKKTRPHYVRCIKPNDKNISNDYDLARTLEQLRYGGVLEAVKVSRAGFPIRFYKKEFNNRYYMLNLNIYKIENCQIGVNKIFLKQKAYDLLEDQRKYKIRNSVITIQKTFKMYQCKKLLKKTLKKVLIVQSISRMRRAIKLLLKLRQEKASILIQTYFRKYSAQRKFNLVRKFIVNIKIKFHKKYINNKAYTIQKWFNKNKISKIIKTKERAVIKIQRWFKPIYKELSKKVRINKLELEKIIQQRVEEELKKKQKETTNNKHIQIKKVKKTETKPKQFFFIENQFDELIKEIEEIQKEELKEKINNIKEKVKQEKEVIVEVNTHWAKKLEKLVTENEALKREVLNKQKRKSIFDLLFGN